MPEFGIYASCWKDGNRVPMRSIQQMFPSVNTNIAALKWLYMTRFVSSIHLTEREASSGPVLKYSQLATSGGMQEFSESSKEHLFKVHEGFMNNTWDESLRQMLGFLSNSFQWALSCENYTYICKPGNFKNNFECKWNMRIEQTLEVIVKVRVLMGPFPPQSTSTV